MVYGGKIKGFPDFSRFLNNVRVGQHQYICLSRVVLRWWQTHILCTCIRTRNCSNLPVHIVLEHEADRKRESTRPLLCTLPCLCHSSSGGKTVYCWGQGPRCMFTGSLRWAIVVKAHPVHAKATPKIISSRAPLPWGQMKPILTRFIRPTHKSTFKTHLEFQDKTSALLVYLSPVAISLLDPHLFFHNQVNLITFALWFALRHAELNITLHFHGHSM